MAPVPNKNSLPYSHFEGRRPQNTGYACKYPTTYLCSLSAIACSSDQLSDEQIRVVSRISRAFQSESVNPTSGRLSYQTRATHRAVTWPIITYISLSRVTSAALSRSALYRYPSSGRTRSLLCKTSAHCRRLSKLYHVTKISHDTRHRTIRMSHATKIGRYVRTYISWWPVHVPESRTHVCGGVGNG